MAPPARTEHADPATRDPLAEFRSLVSQLTRFPDPWGELVPQRSGFTPLADVEETDDSYLIEVELPGAGTGRHLDNLRDGFRRTHEAIAAFVDTLTDTTLAEMREIRPDQYNNWTRNERRLWDAMVHVVNHTTQHRAEAAAKLTTMGRSPGDLELDELMVSRTTAP